MPRQPVVSHQEWTDARRELLRREKEFTRLRDEIVEARQALPWERVETEYIFDGPNGPESLSDLFGEASQLIVYHFMFGPDWDEGCISCSFLADHFNPITIHIEQRDTAFAAISRAPLDVLDSYRQRMGWGFRWLSSNANSFNFDYGVSFSDDEVEASRREYNYTLQSQFDGGEAPGLSVFYKDDTGDIFHTYSTYARGLEDFIGTYRFLDVLPKGRDEADLPWGMAWVRRHDQYNAGLVEIAGID